MIRSTCRCAVSLILALVPASLFAQWVDYPTPRVPRSADGKPDLAAPAPRGTDGKPDFSGMWGWENRFNCGAKCNDTQISREFINIAASLKDPVPYQPWAAELVKKRSVEQGLDPTCIACRAELRESGPTITTSEFSTSRAACSS